jgi:phosphatidylinositol alpha-mannosyltransferase
MTPHAIWSSLASVTPEWLAAAVLLNAAALMLRGLAWLVLLRAALPGARVGAAGVLRATMIGVMGSALVPGRVGEPARAWLIARRHGALATVLGTMVAQTLVNLAALALLAAVALTGAGPFRTGPGALATVAAVPVGIALALAGGGTLARAAARTQRLQGAGRWTLRQIDSLRAGLLALGPWRRGALIAAAQLGAWLLQLLAAAVLLVALHLEGGLGAAAAILLAVNVTAAVPVTPSNVGVFQATCVAVLAAYGVAPSAGLAYGVLLQAAELVTAVAMGVPALLGEGVGLRGLRRFSATSSGAGRGSPPPA